MGIKRISVREIQFINRVTDERDSLEYLALKALFDSASMDESQIVKRARKIDDSIRGFAVGDNYLFVFKIGREGRKLEIISTLPADYKGREPERQAYQFQ